MDDGPYYAQGNTVYRRAFSTRRTHGTENSLAGFKVCEVDAGLGPEGPAAIVGLLNLGDMADRMVQCCDRE